MEIRKLAYEDLELRVKWMNDIRISKTLNIQLPVTIESTQSWYERIKSNPTRIDFALIDGNRVVAMGGFTDIDNSTNEAESYLFVDPEIKGKGYGTKAKRLMCDYGFGKMSLKKIYAHISSDNIASIKVNEKLGFKLERCTKGESIVNGDIKDRLLYVLHNPTGGRGSNR